MKFIKENIVVILFIGIAVLITLQLDSCFSKVQKPSEMIRNEERIKMYEEELPKIKEELTTITAKYDSLISASQGRQTDLSKTYTATKIVYEKIPATVNDYDREQLRRAIANY